MRIRAEHQSRHIGSHLNRKCVLIDETLFDRLRKERTKTKNPVDRGRTLPEDLPPSTPMDLINQLYFRIVQAQVPKTDSLRRLHTVQRHPCASTILSLSRRIETLKNRRSTRPTLFSEHVDLRPTHIQQEITRSAIIHTRPNTHRIQVIISLLNIRGKMPGIEEVVDFVELEVPG